MGIRVLLMTIFGGYRHQGVVADNVLGDIGIRVLLITIFWGI